MSWLFWKEYRQNRVVVIALIVMLVVPHLFGLSAMGYQWHIAHFRGFPWQQLGNDWRGILWMACLYSFGISQLALALIGGNVIAGERADRSAEFQNYLPLSREKILFGKLLLVLAIAGVIWIINPLVAWSTLAPSVTQIPGLGDLRTFMFYTAITGLVFFCVAWLFSTILRSPTFSVAAGLIAPLVILSLIEYGGYLMLGEHWRHRADWILENFYVWVSLAVAILAFGVGTWLYLRRVEP